MTPADPLFGPVVLTLAMIVACLCWAVGIGLVDFADWMRKRRRLKRLRNAQPYDARFTNSVLTKDWRDTDRAQKGLREAA